MQLRSQHQQQQLPAAGACQQWPRCMELHTCTNTICPFLVAADLSNSVAAPLPAVMQPAAVLQQPVSSLCCAAGVNEAFVRLHEQGLVYRSAFLINWSPGLRTAISDLEVRCEYAQHSTDATVQLCNSALHSSTIHAACVAATLGPPDASLSLRPAQQYQVQHSLCAAAAMDVSRGPASVQVDYAEEEGTLYHFKYPLADAEGDVDHLPVATTRPETILGDTAVAVHPEDPRYKHLIGRQCTVPLCDGRCASMHYPA